MSQEVADEEPPRRLDAAFQALPALGSVEYLAYIDQALPADLPPEVLVRALRQLPAGSVAWQATLARLFRQREIAGAESRPRSRPRDLAWDYLGPLVAYARRQARRGKRDDYGDLLQDALTQIVKVLPTRRGAFAERAWHSFCRRELSNAWRERYGRRGERFPREEPAGIGRTEKEADPFAHITVAPPWHAVMQESNVRRIEEVAQQVVGVIQDKFVRSVAEAAWFNTERPRVSGRWDKGASLSALFPGKSRYQLMRALRHADSQLAAALLVEPNLEWTDDLRNLLKNLAGDPDARGRRPKQERKR
jgi:DNA-directed RNA polymerase specialized sigma24 family protein